MISVAVMINGNPIMARSAVNKVEQDGDGKTKYLCDDGTVVWHSRCDGAVALAKKLLDTIKE